MREIFIQERKVQNIKLMTITRGCENCIKADVCGVKAQCEQVFREAQKLAGAHLFTIKIECPHFVEC